jgi:hypothetical protein
VLPELALSLFVWLPPLTMMPPLTGSPLLLTTVFPLLVALLSAVPPPLPPLPPPSGSAGLGGSPDGG